MAWFDPRKLAPPANSANPANPGPIVGEKRRPISGISGISNPSALAAEILELPRDVLAGPSDTAADTRLAAVVTRLTECPELVYSMNTHDDVEQDFVLLSLAIRGKGACELRIPRGNYDPFKLLEMVGKLPKQPATEEIII